jgi:hypothetical protein
MRGEVELRPRKRASVGAASQTSEPQAAKERLRSDFDRMDRQGAGFDGKLDIADAGQASATAVDDLGVENVPSQKKLVLCEGGGDQLGTGRQRDRVSAETGDGGPRDFSQLSAGPAHPQADNARVRSELNDEVEESADLTPLRGQDGSADDLGDPDHRLPALRACAGVHACHPDAGVDRHASFRKGEHRIEIELRDRGKILREP